MHPSRAIRIVQLREIPPMVSKPTTAGPLLQFGADPRLHRILTHWLGLIALCLMLCGCNSIYHQTWATMPPDGGTRVTLRMEEARATDQSARAAARQLLALLREGGNENLIQAGFDRLERQSLELDRKVLAVRDEGDTGVAANEDQELAGLTDRANTWRQFATENRSVDPHIAAKRLEPLLGQSVRR